jgi:predicted ATPase
MLNATTLLLEPLSAVETGELIGSLAGGALGADLRERIGAAAGGNPLFVEEMVAMAAEGDGADLAVPPTIQALLAARIDQLDPGERGVLARGAVEGQVFHLGAVRALAPEEPEPGLRVTSLVRKELLRPEQSLLPAEDAYRFRHLLIRDAAYDALPKSSRAELHERFADWLDVSRPHMIEVDELRSYHLEQAVRYETELGHADPTLIERAANQLAVAGRRALWRSDWRAAINLLERALAVAGPTELSVALESDLAKAHALEERERATATTEAAGARVP